jgi:type 1 fimbria pilin
VRAQVAVLDPLAVVTVMVQEPLATAVTSPEPFTVATEPLDVVHATAVFVAFVGVTEASSCKVPPGDKDAEVRFKDTPVTFTIPVTVTAHVAVLFPSAVVTVIVVDPAEIPVKRPDVLTVATPGLEEVHVTALFVAFSGTTVAVSCWVAPTSKVAVD